MIPKPLNEIEWSDIVALKDDGRQEDDMLEFKQAFSVEENGTDTFHSDYRALNKNQRKKANASIAKHVIAFLNGRGGDLILGVQEEGNENPIIKGFTLLQNVNETSDRLGRAMAEIVEPHQTALSIWPVLSPENDGSGILVLRASPSLRAPHRSTVSQNCYVRRGRQSVPMRMDEVQDLTLNRAMRRSERFDLLSKQFEGIAEGLLPLRKLPSPRFHARLVYVPFSDDEIDLTAEILAAVSGEDPTIVKDNNVLRNDVAFRGLPDRWRPILRGRQKEMYAEASPDGESAFYFCRKSISTNCLVSMDFARYGSSFDGQSHAGIIHVEWVIGYFANSLHSLQRLILAVPNLASGIVRVAFVADGDLTLLVGGRFPDSYKLPSYYSEIPDFETSENVSCNDIFEQLQKDIYSLAGIDPPIIWSLPSP